MKIKSPAYETVTDVPVLVPARFLPGQKAGGTQSFLMYRVPISMPRRKSDPKPKQAPVSDCDQPVVVLHWWDLSYRSRLGARIWSEVGEEAKRDLLRCLELRAVLDDGTGLKDLANLYRLLSGKIWHDQAPDISISERPPESSRRFELWNAFYGPDGRRSRSEHFANTMEKMGKHQTTVAGIVSEALGRARFVLWASRGRFVPAIFCDNLESAIYALALPMFAGGRSLGVCEWCRQIFVKSRVDQLCCTTRHASHARVSRWRAKRRSNRVSKLR
jgi:hypothetical protein